MENRVFQTEVKQLLHMMIHSIYSNKEIFLRELIANAADAIDKARFESLTNPDFSQEWEIRISPDKTAGTLTISDNGIGMTKDEVIENLGTIAHSGTKAFMEAMQNAKEGQASPELIGQFGVGFYSAFMVADKVTVETCKAGSKESVRWESNGEESFSVTEGSRTAQGTAITLHLKDDAKEFLENWQISTIVKKYSDFIEHPVKMMETVKDKDGKETIEDKVLNSQTAIWLRPQADVKDEEYTTFYNHLTGHYDEPISRINYSAEGASEFKALLYIPSQCPFDFNFPGRKRTDLQLYIRRVFISDDCKGLVPNYLRFIAGVVDSSDLPLNISRETLQDNPMIGKINKAITKRVLTELDNLLRNKREEYTAFFKNFGPQLKEGTHEDYANAEKLRNLLLFETLNKPASEYSTLKEYVEAMPADQKEIYYMTGDSREYMEASPHIESFKKAGYDVLMMHEPIDEWVVQAIPEYDGKKLVSVAKAKISADSAAMKELNEKAEKAAQEQGGKDLISKVKEVLADKVKDVRFSGAMTESVSRLSGEENDPSPHMQRIVKALNQPVMEVKRILELNPSHPLIEGLTKLVEKDSSNPKVAEYAELLFDQALLAEGSPLPDPAKFAKRAAVLMAESIEKEI
ncbi:MAG: molecular chaperone HtpG [Lentisphaeria bacterium]|nr:molecular chaperone HtpG [Lentisphaeria bacterium]